MLRRYREPLVGLTVAGAMVPVAKAATQAPAKAKTPKRGAERVAAEETRQRDIEERLSQRWSAAEAESERETIIRNAMDRYGISRDLAADIHDIALEEGIEPELAYGLVNTESSFQPRAVSHVGARGYTQLMPATARWLQPGLTAEDLFDRDLNLHIGFQYLNQLIGDYDGDVRLALLAYNRGPGTVDRVLSQGGNPDNGYADKVLSG